MKAYTYWECSYCQSTIRGDSRTCPNCGAPIPNNVKYMMPNDPRVEKARREGKLLVGKATHVDEKGVVSELVEAGKERSAPNWKCPSCGFQNFAESTTCAGCGAEKSGISYFDDEEDESDNDESSSVFEQVTDTQDITRDVEEEPEPKEDKTPSFFARLKDYIHRLPAQYVFGTIGAIAVIAFLIWLFTPIWRTATVKGFEWRRDITVERFTLCHEDGWSVPAGGRITEERQEIHHYDTVIDHYETKSRQVSEEVFDGYDTEYREVAEEVFDGYDTDYIDLGNGQCDVVQTPRYRTEYRTESYQVPKYHTEWHTEYYEEPVYKDVPVYKTKYYYDIDKWLYDSTLTTIGRDHSPYWSDTDIPEDVENPEYGDLRLGSRKETYTVKFTDDKGEPYTLNYNLAEWSAFEIGDELRYKSFRFSRRPISDVTHFRTRKVSTENQQGES